MALGIKLSAAEDSAEVVAFRCAAFGEERDKTLKEVQRHMRAGKVFVARRRGKVIATICLTPKKPWAIDASYFTPVRTALYLLGMAVAPPLQRKGIGRRCLLEADHIALNWPAQAIRLDAYDCRSGAGPFYQGGGYREVGRAVYRQMPLIYYEKLITPTNAA